MVRRQEKLDGSDLPGVKFFFLAENWKGNNEETIGTEEETRDPKGPC